METDFDKKVSKLETWFKNLSELDQTNFSTLVSLPNAVELVAKLGVNGGNGEYVDMAIFAIAARRVLGQETVQ